MTPTQHATSSHSLSHRINLALLEKVKQRGGKIIARCPACAEDQRDRSGEHLAIFPDGRFACSAHAGDHEHRRRIFALVGLADDSSPRNRSPQSPGYIHPAPPAAAPPPEKPLPPDFAEIAARARALLYRSPAAQQRVAAELGLTTATVWESTMPEGGALGFFPRIAIHGRPCAPDRIGYIYPLGIKLRQPWGDQGARFAWAYGRATEPWRYTVAAWRPWISRFIITEGESDALALMQAGLSPLCGGDTAVVASPGTSFPPAWAPLFGGRHVTLCFDTDKAGQEAAHKVATLIHPHALSVSIQTRWEGAAR